MRDILLQILAAIQDLAPVGSLAADPDSRGVSQEESIPEEPKQEEKEAPEETPAAETKSTRRTSK